VNYALWLMRSKRWAQKPPSGKRVRFVMAIIAISAALFAYERTMGWPEMLTPDRVGRMPR
jgi:hypothetical protein